MSKRLIYFTTSGSHAHFKALGCWKVPWVSQYDVHIYSNRELSSVWYDALSRIPSRNFEITIDKNDYGHQQGAIRAFMNAKALFAKYDWVIRTNPDVHVVNHLSFSFWMVDSHIHAILANCNAGVECFTTCPRALVHTDFTVFRPQFLNWNASVFSNAEVHMSMLMKPVLATQKVRWVQRRGYRDGSCRIRAGVREHNKTVVHERSHTGCFA